MKKIIILLFILLYFTLPAQSNPIMPKVISEIYFDDNDNWSIELYDYYQMGIDTLDNSYMISMTDTAHFNVGFSFTSDDTLVVTNADMQTDFTINKNGDVLTMFGYIWGGYINDCISWGDTPYSHVNAPYAGQSLVRVKFYPSWYPSDDPVFYLAKENEPSLGYNPFNAQTSGSFIGQVTDGDGIPVINADITISPADYHNSTLSTDENGYFEISFLYALNYNLSTTISGYPTIETTVSIEPDSTTYVHIFPIYDTDPSPQQKNYSISNHPNPFYDTTIIHYSLPQHSAGMITIFNSKGQKLKEIPVSHLENSVSWTGIDEQHNQVPSGVYFYQLESENVTLASGKMLYLR